MYGDVLKDKIISLFIETLVINGVNSLDSLVKENITVKDLLNQDIQTRLYTLKDIKTMKSL